MIKIIIFRLSPVFQCLTALRKKLLRTFLLICVLTAGAQTVFSQHYLRGKVMSSSGQWLPSVKITAMGSRQVVKSDLYGNFGFSSSLPEDSLVFSCDGYDTLGMRVKADQYAGVMLRPLPYSVIFSSEPTNTLVIKKEEREEKRTLRGETYLQTDEFAFIPATQSAGIAFSANINRASYSNVRRLINDMESLLPPNAVRVEEMLNYFSFSYTQPEKDSMFHCKTWLTNCPWKTGHELFFMNISARRINMDSIPPNNLVFLIDASGSMDMPNKLPLLKSGFIKMVRNLRPVDKISIITFGDRVNLLLEGVSGAEQERIIRVLNKLQADGPTPGESAIRLAFNTCRKTFVPNGNNRIIMAADGDFNVGMSTEKELITLIEQEKQRGIYMSCLGVGSGNYKDSRLALLAQKGKGNFSYIDNEQEAERVLVTDLTKTLFTVAENVYIHASFNPKRVQSFRLLGYENESVVFKDSMLRLRGGEIGSGHSLMAVFELVPVINVADSQLGKLDVYYQEPMKHTELKQSYASYNKTIPIQEAEVNVRKSASVVMFGIKLKDSEFSKAISWRQLQKLAGSCFDPQNYLENEFLQLIRKAKKMYTHRKKYGGE